VNSPRSIRRYQRDDVSAQSALRAGESGVNLGLLGTTELDVIVRGLARTVGAQAGLLAVSDEAGEVVEVLGTWGDVMGLENLPATLTDGFVGRALASERAVLEPIDADGPAAMTASGTALTHAVSAAVRAPTGLAGAVCALFSTAPLPDGEETLRMVESYARLASLCLGEPRLLEGLLTTAQLDGLTGCLNYTAIRHELEREVRRSERHQLSLSCCFLDLDDFKLVNDRHGHLYGSAMLVDVATILAGAVRSEDTLGRFGGDEFIAILPETGEQAAIMLAERVLSTLSSPSRRFRHREIGASIGVAQWAPGSSGEEMLDAADSALRAAKSAGGARVIAASDLRGRTGHGYNGPPTLIEARALAGPARRLDSEPDSAARQAQGSG
jgi:diguanylate cyclase (GGDEF)-like protein